MPLSSLKELNHSVANIPQKLLSGNEIHCAICFQPLSNKNSPMNLTMESIIEVITILGFNCDNNKLEQQSKKVNACRICCKLFSDLTEAFAMLKEIKLHFIDLRGKVGKQVILETLKRPVHEYDEWKNIIQSIEKEFPASQIDLKATKNLNLKQPKDDAKLHKMTPVVLLERLLSPIQVAVKPVTDIITEEIKIEPEFSYDLERVIEDNYYPPYDDDFEISPDVDLGNAAEDQRMNNLDVTKFEQEEDEYTKNDSISKSPSKSLLSTGLNNGNIDSGIQLRKRKFSKISKNSAPSESDSNSDFHDQEDFVPSDNSSHHSNKSISTTHKAKKLKKHSSSKSKDSLKCLKCSVSFNAKYLLRRHLKEAHNEFHCYECTKFFDNESEYSQHIKEKHSRPGKKKFIWKCRQCPIKLSCSKGEIIHMANIHGIFIVPPTLTCTFCDLTFNEPKLLNLHKLYVHNFGILENEISQCDLCLKFMRSKRNVRDHKRLAHYGNRDPGEGEVPQNIKCFICGECPEYSKPEDLKVHEESEEHQMSVKSRISVHCNVCKKNFEGNVEDLQEHLKGKEHEDGLKSLGDYDRAKFCVPCRKEFNSFEELKKHESLSLEHLTACRKFKEVNRKDEAPLNQPQSCHECHKVFKMKGALEKHVERFHSPNGHKCKICGLLFAEWTHFILHRSSHKKDDTKTTTCDTCGKSFPNLKSLGNHMRTTHSDQSVKCETCGKVFKCKQHLQSHMRTIHEGILTRHECPHCDEFVTTHMIPLRKHLCRKHPKEHLKDKRKFCSVCYHTFRNKKELNSHMQSHNDVKCPTCRKYCLTAVALKNHLRVHTGERPFACPLCDSKFKTNGNLKNHTLARHNDDNDSEKE